MNQGNKIKSDHKEREHLTNQRQKLPLLKKIKAVPSLSSSVSDTVFTQTSPKFCKID